MAVLNLGKPTFASGSSSWTTSYGGYNGGTFALTGATYDTSTSKLTVTLTYNRSGYNSQGVYASLNNDRTSMGNSSNYTSVASGWGTSIGTGEYYAVRKTSTTTVTISSGNTSNISMLKNEGGASSGQGVTGITMTVSSVVSTSAILNGTVPIYMQAIYSSGWKGINSDRWIGTTGGYSKKNNTTLKFPNNTNKFEYTISYDANGGSGAPGNQTKQSGVALTISSTIPTRATENTTGGYVVSFDPNGGSCGTTSLISTYRRSWTFNYWSDTKYSSIDYLRILKYYGTKDGYLTPSDISLYDTNQDGVLDAVDKQYMQDSIMDAVGISVEAGASLTTEISQNTILYAHYTASDTQNAITLPTPTRPGHKFKGWATSKTATSGSTGSYTPTSNITLYAIWEKTPFPLLYKNSSNSFVNGGVVKVKNSSGNWVTVGNLYVKNSSGQFVKL